MNALKVVAQPCAEPASVTAHAQSWTVHALMAACAIARPKADGFVPAAPGALAYVARAPQRFPDVDVKRGCLV